MYCFKCGEKIDDVVCPVCGYNSRSKVSFLFPLEEVNLPVSVEHRQSVEPKAEKTIPVAYKTPYKTNNGGAKATSYTKTNNQGTVNKANANQTKTNQSKTNQTKTNQTKTNQAKANPTRTSQANTRQANINQSQAKQTAVNQTRGNATPTTPPKKGRGLIVAALICAIAAVSVYLSDNSPDSVNGGNVSNTNRLEITEPTTLLSFRESVEQNRIEAEEILNAVQEKSTVAENGYNTITTTKIAPSSTATVTKEGSTNTTAATTEASTYATYIGTEVAENYLELTVGSAKALPVSFSYMNPDDIIYSTSNAAVARVDKSGVVTGISKGKANIKMQATKDNETYYYECEVTVV